MADSRHMLERSAGADAGRARMSRAHKAEATRRKLIDAAARVVGAEGYANASVAKITALADVAQGTFYNYFSSQQDLFDHLLPELGASLLDFIRERVARETDSFEREAIGFRAFFEFVRGRPEFYRILNEAETFAPKAFEEHMRNMADGYLRALRKSAAKGEIADFADRELEIIVYTLLAARNYLWFRYMRNDHRSGPVPEWVVVAYMKLVESGIRPARSARASQKTRTSTLAPRFEAERLRRTVGGRAVELVASDADRDASRQIGRSAQLDLLEATGSLLSQAATKVSVAPELISLGATFLRPTSAERLIGSGIAEATSEHIAITLSIHEAGSEGRASIATAQALYRLSASESHGNPAQSAMPRLRNLRKL